MFNRDNHSQPGPSNRIRRLDRNIPRDGDDYPVTRTPREENTRWRSRTLQERLGQRLEENTRSRSRTLQERLGQRLEENMRSRSRAPQEPLGRPHRERAMATSLNRDNMQINEGDIQRRIRKQRDFDSESDRSIPNKRFKYSIKDTENRSTADNKLSFKTLQEIANADANEIFIRINTYRTGFLNSIKSTTNKHDLFAVFIEILTKLCTGTKYDQMKSKIILEVCNSNFIYNLQTYLLELPYARDKASNNMYWGKPMDFWKNFITFLDYITSRNPTTAVEKLRMLIDLISQSCLERLEEKHAFKLDEELNEKFAELRVKFRQCEKKQENVVRIKGVSVDDSEPPEDFRELNIIPTRDELLEERPFLRANVVSGGYRDIEHYLDIQFRLLREDCFGPLREGLLQYKNDPKKRKYENIRVYRDVKFVQPHLTADGIGFIVQINTDLKWNKYLKRIRWANSKRFMKGSLLLFTRDACVSFTIATVMDRTLLFDGKLAVTIIDKSNNTYFMDDSFVMIESEVYFEPYRHVLKALQNPDFPRHLAMSKYIVEVDPEPRPPAYLDPDTEFVVKRSSQTETNLTVLNSETWPTQKELGFNESQYEAFKLALTHEFAVIQGPPGTGKTFLGVKVAETLLNNLSFNRKCVMLVICYTNHALDQFLENILPITESIVRIGGRSRNEAMDKINLNQLRRQRRDNNYNRRFMTRKTHEYKDALAHLQKEYEQLDYLCNGVVSFNCLLIYLPQVRQFFRENSNHDPLHKWLFEVCDELNYTDFEIEDDYQSEVTPASVEDNEDTGAARRDNVFQNDDDFEAEELSITKSHAKFNIELSFFIKKAHLRQKELISDFKKSHNEGHKKNIKYEIFLIKNRIKLFKEMSARKRTKYHINNWMNLSTLPAIQRWDIYFDWIKEIVEELKQTIAYREREVSICAEQYKDARMLVDLDLLSDAKVIGMTTTGAAMWREMLENISPPIVIIEEAAEVLEQHIVASLTKGCLHLILIGDHQQLRPSISNLKLARKVNIDVSLFERMITNSIHSKRLSVQHRMRPEIATLISPHIYPDLENHSSVECYPPVRGVQYNMFFYTHDFKEEAQGDDDNVSRSNIQEADMVLHFADYLMKQGYEPSDVTILAAYSGQLFYMKRKRNEYPFLEGVKITVVDNYQGEESKIILLSLVRNNDKDEIGFLSIKNRICVALSRAKEGFYIFGNMETLKKKSELWQKICNTLESVGSIGSTLALRCENHSDQNTVISAVDDFKKVPEGGCLLNCNFEKPCGHKCPKLCHGYDTDHNKIPCREKCERTCENGHPCSLICGVECKPCQVLVLKELPCGHSMNIYCHRAPDDPVVKCTVIVKVKLSSCGHENDKPCHLDVKDVQCQTRCPNRIDTCGHNCLRLCHVNDDPYHEQYVCMKPCARTKKDCNAGLELDFGDHQCKKKCFECCDNCDVMVTKLIQGCNHKVPLQCHMEPHPQFCTSKCDRMLLCGHFCDAMCNEVCDISNCTKMNVETVESPCSHHVTVPCNIYRSMNTEHCDPKLLLRWCKQACKKELECGHICSGSCTRCLQGRIHMPCMSPCSKIQLCGHACKQPCNAVCPPCTERCIVKCWHSQCNKPCGAPCVSCKERCKRNCKHAQCSRRCGEKCSVAACSEPCGKSLPCGHACRGVCSEPCPPACKTCHPEDYPVDTLITGLPYEDDALLIQLHDCKHIFDVVTIDNWVFVDRETISLPTCPLCKANIINNYRYKDHINNMIKKQINPIKLKIFGTSKQRQGLLAKVKKTSNDFLKLHDELCKEYAPWGTACKNIKHQLLKIEKNRVSLPNLQTLAIHLNILNVIGKCFRDYKADKSSTFYDELRSQIKTICAVLQINSQRLSLQQQLDISNEINRLNAIVQLSKITSHESYSIAKSTPEVIEAVKNAKKFVFCVGVYSDVEAMSSLKNVQEKMKGGLVVIKRERDLIVKAIGVKAGAWYKCPNGHFYCIGDCGGAASVGKCIECKAEVGGHSHALLPTNSHAPEMDSSRHPAW